MNAIRFGTELARPFEVAEPCYDCAAFYDGCNAWPASIWPTSGPIPCADFNRLPNVQSCGQVFPPSRMGERTEPRAISDTDTPRPTAKRKPSGPRQCDCGAGLDKGKRLCDDCRDQRRKRSKRDHMRGYMRQRRSGPDKAGSDSPFLCSPRRALATNAAHRGIDKGVPPKCRLLY